MHTVEKLNKIKRIRSDLTGTLHHEPTLAELAEACQSPMADMRALLDWDVEPISNQTPLGEGLADISELIMDDDLPQPDEYATQDLRRSDITLYLDALPTRGRTILEARFGFRQRACVSARSGIDIRRYGLRRSRPCRSGDVRL